MISQTFSYDSTPREYFQISSIVFREVKGYSIPKTASDLWVILYDLAKFDSNREVKISIDKLCDIVARGRSTVESHLRSLEKKSFIKRLPNFTKIGSRLINTYKVLIPVAILEKLKTSEKKVSITPDHPIIKNLPMEHDILNSISATYVFEDNSELLISPVNSMNISTPPSENCGTFNKSPKEIYINNCYNDNKGSVDNSIGNSLISEDAEIVNNEFFETYYPAKEKPASLKEAKLRHCLKKKTVFEKTIGNHLTDKQKAVINQIIAFWKTMKYVSSPTDCFDWVRAAVLRPSSLSRCGNSFLAKINVIIKMIRARQFSKPFVERYKSRDEYRAEKSKKKLKPLTEQATTRLSAKEQEKLEKIEQLKALINVEEVRLNSPEVQGNASQYKAIKDYIQSMVYKIQEVQYA